MSCGFSAQSLELIAQLQQQEQRKQAEDEAAALRRAAEAPLPEVRDRQREWDWAQRYEQWQQWQAEQDRQEAKEKLEAVQQKKQDRPPMPSCDHDHSAERRLYEMSIPEQVQEIQGHKRLGDAYYREGQYARAFRKYHMALIVFEYSFPDTEEDTAAMNRLRALCHMNSAAAALKLDAWEDVIQHCTQALALEPDSAKALFRRAVAHRARDEFDEATADLARAAELAPTDSAVRLERALLASLMAAYARRRRLVSKAMFGGDRNAVGSRAGPGGAAGGEGAEGGADDDGMAEAARGLQSLEQEDRDARRERDQQTAAAGVAQPQRALLRAWELLEDDV